MQNLTFKLLITEQTLWQKIYWFNVRTSIYKLIQYDICIPIYYKRYIFTRVKEEKTTELFKNSCKSEGLCINCAVLPNSDQYGLIKPSAVKKNISTNFKSKRNQITIMNRKLCKNNRWNFHSSCTQISANKLHLNG